MRIKSKFAWIGASLGLCSVLIYLWLDVTYKGHYSYESIFIDIQGSNQTDRFAKSETWEMKPSPPVPITDQNILLLIYGVAVLFSFLAICLAAMAERIGESTLYSAASLMFGVTTIMLINQFAGVAALLAGFLVMIHMRRKREHNP